MDFSRSLNFVVMIISSFAITNMAALLWNPQVLLSPTALVQCPCIVIVFQFFLLHFWHYKIIAEYQPMQINIVHTHTHTHSLSLSLSLSHTFLIQLKHKKGHTKEGKIQAHEAKLIIQLCDTTQTFRTKRRKFSDESVQWIVQNAL